MIVSEKGDVLITGQSEVGEKLTPIHVETLRAKPRPEPWLKRDFGVAVGVCWDFDKTVEPCVRIQTWRWLGSITAPDPIVTLKDAGVSANFPVRIWFLKNTSVGASVKWEYREPLLTPDVAVVITVQL